MTCSTGSGSVRAGDDERSEVTLVEMNPLVSTDGGDALELNLYEVVTDLTVPASTLEHQLFQS
jgi:hypothetical protein